MIEILFTVFFSVAAAILLKVTAGKHNLTVLIAFNYVAGFALALIFLHPVGLTPALWSHSWWLFLFLGMWLPAIFLLMGRAISTIGIIKTDVAQRLALFLPLIAAFTLFHEPVTLIKGAAIILAFAAMWLLSSESASSSSPSFQRKNVLLFLGILVGCGISDILFKQVATEGATFALTLTLTFALAAVMMLIVLVLHKPKINFAGIMLGLLLGVLNFANIYCYLAAHRAYAESPALIFTAVNIGTIILGTMVGKIIFGEPLNNKNRLAIAFAVFSIFLLFWGRTV